jgi:hypothetical protein
VVVKLKRLSVQCLTDVISSLCNVLMRLDIPHLR